MSEGRFVALSTKILNMKYPKLNPLIYFLSVSSTQSVVHWRLRLELKYVQG